MEKRGIDVKRKFRLSEKQLGYAFVLPALLLVFVVIIWPIMQSFWNSMFDYKLNDPARSEKMLSSNIDLENYVDNLFYLPKQLENIKENIDDPDKATTIADMEASIDGFHNELLSD